VYIRKISSALAAAGLLVTLATTAGAQQQGGAAAAQAGGAAQPAAAAAQRRTIPVAVIDLGHIIRNHPTMKQEMERIKTQAETTGGEFEKRRQSILKKMEELRANYTEGTEDYMKMEKEIADLDTAFRLEVVRKNKEFDEARASVFYQVHQQVTALIQYYCQHSGTFVVLRVSREKLDPKKPETIEMGMGQEVFYYNPAPDVDITDWVLQQLNTQAAANTARAPGAPVR
jgi:Skp family chaperone for outer membrane proteins